MRKSQMATIAFLKKLYIYIFKTYFLEKIFAKTQDMSLHLH